MGNTIFSLFSLNGVLRFRIISLSGSFGSVTLLVGLCFEKLSPIVGQIKSAAEGEVKINARVEAFPADH
jgi:hypothetical protein